MCPDIASSSRLDLSENSKEILAIEALVYMRNHAALSIFKWIAQSGNLGARDIVVRVAGLLGRDFCQ
jgi:hypothetical protein